MQQRVREPSAKRVNEGLDPYLHIAAAMAGPNIVQKEHEFPFGMAVHRLVMT